MRLSEAGKVIQTVWGALPERHANIDLDIAVILPNHVRGIIVLTDSSDLRAGLALPGSKSAVPRRAGRPYIARRNSDI
jgi:hypothetical protein